MRSVVFCFFFKQKTAYEMRISDWSVDVCSSDLQRLHHRHRADQSRWNVVELHLARVGLGRRSGLAVERDVEQIGRHAAHGEIAPLQIGSASCRERVCQYV